MKWTFLSVIIFLTSCDGLIQNSNSELIEKMLHRGFKSDSLEDFKSSIHIYDSVLQIKPDNYIALVNRGRAKIYTGDTLAGIADLNASIKINPTYQAFASKAMVALLRDPKQALGDLKAAEHSFPQQGMIIALLAYYYTAIHPLRDSALYYANYARKLSTTQPSSYGVLMNAYLYFNDYSNLFKMSDSMIVYYPTFAYPYNNRGLARLNYGDIQGAKRDIIASLRLDSTNAWAYRNMSLVFEKMNRPDSACYYIKLARQKDKKQQYTEDLDSLILKFCDKR